MPDAEREDAVGARPSLLRDLTQFPYRRMVIETKLSEGEIVGRLRAIVEPGRPFFVALGRTNKLFAGEVSAHGFEITRLISYSNPSLPLISGRLDPGLRITRVSIELRLRRRTTYFNTIWFASVILFTVVAILATIFSAQKKDSEFLILIGGAMTLFGYLLMVVPFGAEARITQRLLEEALAPTPGPRIQKVLNAAPRRLPRVVTNTLLPVAVGAGVAALITSILLLLLAKAR